MFDALHRPATRGSLSSTLLRRIGHQQHPGTADVASPEDLKMVDKNGGKMGESAMKNTTLLLPRIAGLWAFHLGSVGSVALFQCVMDDWVPLWQLEAAVERHERCWNDLSIWTPQALASLTPVGKPCRPRGRRKSEKCWGKWWAYHSTSVAGKRKAICGDLKGQLELVKYCLCWFLMISSL